MKKERTVAHGKMILALMRRCRRRVVTACAGVLAALAMTAEAATTDFHIEPFTEAVAIVRNADAVADTLVVAAGWEKRLHGVVDPALLQLWRVPDARAGQWLLGAPGSERGFLRLVQFDGVEQQRIRPFDQPWETGGLFDVNVRVNDLAAFYQALEPYQWHAATEPVHLEAFGHKQWLPRGPDGVRLSPIERVAESRPAAFPELTGKRGELSRAFNATQIVQNLEETVAFYREVLGFRQVIDSPDTRLGAGANVFGLPYDQVASVRLPFAVLSADGSRDGTLELISFEGARGRDFSDRAHPPNLGMLMLRFPVVGLDALAARLRQHDVAVVGEIESVVLPPYGNVRLLAVRGPEGMWLEFYEAY